jgi:DNA-3-methyladenine glycosylase
MTLDSNAAPHARRSSFEQDLPALSSAFYDRPTARVARDLLGAVLECRIDGETTSGRIVEVEAYLGPHDPACHAVAGLTERNRQLHGPPGTAYVYRIYGLHWCVNAVTQAAGIGSAVLVRALVPLQGLDAMRRRRNGVPDRTLANGPGKLCQALGIDGTLDGARLDGVPFDGLPHDGVRHGGAGEGRVELLVRGGISVPDREVVVTSRIGISRGADWPLRFFVAREKTYVSRTPRGLPRLSLREARAWLRERALR